MHVREKTNIIIYCSRTVSCMVALLELLTALIIFNAQVMKV